MERSLPLCLLLWQTAVGENATGNLGGGGSNTALVVRLLCAELSQWRAGSRPAPPRCGQDATQGPKYESRAASSNDSTTAPLRPGSSCRAARIHQPSAVERLLSPGDRSHLAVLVAARGGHDGQMRKQAATGASQGPRRPQGGFLLFCLRGTGTRC